MSDALAVLVRVNLAASLAILAVIALRRPARRAFGARVAYGLWLLAPLTAAAMLAPARVVTISAPAASPEVPAIAPAAIISALPATTAAPFDATPWLVGLWAAGALACALWLARSQRRFRRAARAGRAGPAAVGVLKPRVVLPADFEVRYGPRERDVILAHERTHIARGDPRINALVAAARCGAWFNPLVHLAAHLLRIDQELACDAAVVAAHPKVRRTYAEAMLKTQLAARPLPLGCYWPAPAAHPLAERIGLLGRALPGRRRQAAGTAAVALLALTGAAAAWGARPPQLLVLPAQAPRDPIEAPAAAEAPHAVQPPARRMKPQGAPIATSSTPPVQPTPAPAIEAAPAEAAASPSPLEADPDAGRFRPRVQGSAERSSVEAGWAVRVVATMNDPEGHRLITDLTSFGSQSLYRSGYIARGGSRYSLFTSVVQQGGTLLVTASLGGSFRPGRSATVSLSPGETGHIVLPDGQTVTVTATLRRETPEEVEAGRRWAERPVQRVAFAPDPFRCGRRGAVC